LEGEDFGCCVTGAGRLVALLRLNLFSYRNLWDWLDDPFETPPQLPDPSDEACFLDSIRHPSPDNLPDGGWKSKILPGADFQAW